MALQMTHTALGGGWLFWFITAIVSLFQHGGRGDGGRRTGSAAECEPDGGCARTPELPEGDRRTRRDVRREKTQKR